MKNSIWTASIFTTFLIVSVLTNGGTEDEISEIDSNSAFEKLKAMVGEWKGTVQEKSTGPAVVVEYRLTAQQTAVMETLFPDTDHEMLTIYYMDGDQLMATHYCAMGNQPRFRFARNSKANELNFEFAGGGQNLDPETDIHMHSGRILFIDDDHVESEWDIYSGGKKEGSNRFYISRLTTLDF